MKGTDVMVELVYKFALGRQGMEEKEVVNPFPVNSQGLSTSDEAVHETDHQAYKIAFLYCSSCSLFWNIKNQ